MNNKKLFIVFIAIIICVISLGALTLIKATSALESEGSKLMDVKIEDEIMERRIKDLAKAKKDVARYSELSDISKQVVPEEKNQASLIAELSSMANQCKIKLGTIDFPKSSLGSIQKKNSKTKTDTSKSQLFEIPEMKGVYAMEIGMKNHSNSPVSYDQILQFLKILENNRKTSQVTNISITPKEDNKNLYDFHIKINTYIRPEN